MPSQKYDPPNRDAAGLATGAGPANTGAGSGDTAALQAGETSAQRPGDTAAQRPSDTTPQRSDQTAAMPAQGESAPPGRLTPPAQSSWSGQPSADPTPAGESQSSAGFPTGVPPTGAAYAGAAGWPQGEDRGTTGRYDQGSYAVGSDQSQQPAYGEYDRSADAAQPADSDAVRAKEKEAFGGVKVGAAFFGWLTAVGATVILVALVAAVASALDLGTVVDGGTTSEDLRSVGIGAAIAVLVVLFLAYYCGGYVAGRMARFNGVRQGFAVWLWAVLIAAAVTGIGLLADNNSDLANDLNLPNIPVDSANITDTGLIALAIVLAVTLIGAIVGGLAGMRFHRRVDRAGFAPDAY